MKPPSEPFVRNSLSLSLTLALFASVLTASAALADPVAPVTSPAGIDMSEFNNPDIEYRPGVRWWWPGNGASKEDLLAQVDYLHDNGFGAVEIVAFSKGFLTGNGTTTGYIYDSAGLGYDTEQILGYESAEYFDKLDAVVARANELGITVDLNIGSGYLANDDSIDIKDSQSNMALGRATVRFDEATGFTLESGNIAVPAGIGSVELGVPTVEVSPFYASELFGFDFGVWSKENTNLNAVIIAPVAAAGKALTTNNQVLSSTFDTVKTYGNQTVIDLAEAQVVYPATPTSKLAVNTDDFADGLYEVIALYSTPAASFGLNSIIANTTTDKRNLVVDHMNADSVSSLVNGWLGEPRLTEIVENNDIRAAFNDSYEFYTDAFYNDSVQTAAESKEVLGYDITPFIPLFYAFQGQSFLIDGAPTIKTEYSALGMNALLLNRFSGGAGNELITSSLTADETARVKYDYNQLINLAFQSGMKSFSDTLGNYGIAYRQQAYNPPVDTLKSSQYVDIPETEGLSEYSLKRVASGAHLYGKNLVTSEVYTLGSVPFNVTPSFIKQGYDLMATSGVNNFFYHGLSATYFGNTDPLFSSDDNLFAEEGWRAWPTIGVEMAQTDPISEYYNSMNQYAARANYTMQSGTQSADVAVYMPLFGSVGSGSSLLKSISTLQTNGYLWDAINDDTIQTGLKWENNRLVANDGNMSFKALVVESDTVPVETMESLQILKNAGAPIYFMNSAPNRQPGYADGNYSALDTQVSSIATAMNIVVDPTRFVAALSTLDDPAITYASNTDVRFNRRTLDSGGELAYLRNTSTSASTTIALQVDQKLSNCYWLDPVSGDGFTAGVTAGKISVKLESSGAIILLCEPAGTEIAAGDLSTGLPLSISSPVLPFAPVLAPLTLSVTADNLATTKPGAVKTKNYTGTVLGDWSADTVLGGDLKYVSASGTYQTTFNVADASTFKEEMAVLSLGEVHEAATVTVNPGTPNELVKQLYYAPYEVDIASALVSGENKIVIDIQPTKSNRRLGLMQLYKSDPVANVKYQAYNSVQGTNALQPAGLVGPVTLKASADSTKVTPTIVDRLAGSDRYGTAIEVSKATFPNGADTVFLASGTVFADAMSVGPAASKMNGPVLLTKAGQIPPAVLAEITRLNPKKIVIVGGTNSVSAGVVTAVGKITATQRISGTDRYETSRKIATFAFGSNAEQAFIATGINYPDALAAGATTGSEGPLILVDGRSTALDTSTAKALRDLGVKKLYVAGGESSVSKKLFTGLQAITTTTRLFGADRYETALALSKHGFVTSERVFIATGADFPDALAGSAAAGVTEAPVLISSKTCVSAGIVARIKELGAKQVTLLGGINTLSKNVQDMNVCK